MLASTDLSTRDLSLQIIALKSALADNSGSDEISALNEAMAGLQRCIDYRPVQTSGEGQRAWLHDFRNHLNAALGYTELCLEEELADSGILNSTLKALRQTVDALSQNPAEPASAESTTPAKAADKTGRILVIEDHPESRALLVSNLRRSGHQVFEAETGQQAFDVMDAQSVDVILLDMILPDMHGRDILQRIKQCPQRRSIPVIVVSGTSEQQEAIRCIELGAEDYLFKPVNQILLQARISASLERMRWRDREQAYLQELAQSHAFIKQTFGRYTSDRIVAQLLEDPHGLDLGGRLQQVTIVMTDISGFTPLCETLTPQQVVQLLNNYLGTLSEVILAHNGTIDEFIGDAILALFGAPYAAEDDADRAVASAVAMQRAMREVNAKNAQCGLPAIETSIAINTGAVVAGNIGSEKRSKFAIVGQPVNATARIEEKAAPGEILLSAATVNALHTQPDKLSPCFEISAKGIEEPLKVHRLEYSLD
jgi:class 3 adenylate cyclase